MLTEVGSIEQKQMLFEQLVASMDIPEIRRKATPENARWFLRNGMIKNIHHKDVHRVVELAKDLY